MIKVIDGKRYNTETAEHIHNHHNGYGYGDFQYRYKRLYRTPKGAWFLRHEGGAMSDMSVQVGNNGRGGSEDIEPISEEDAERFLEAHSGESDALGALDKYFADQVEDA